MKLIDKSRHLGDPESNATTGKAPVIILSRTQMGENAGAVARAMYNFELTELRLVSPLFGWPNAKAVASASGAAGILNRMMITDDMQTAVDDCHHLYATTSRTREMSKPVVTPREAMIEARQLIDQGRRVGVLFGAERTGLENDEIVLADKIVSIPVNPEFWSLNLAQAVLLCAYEWKLAGRPKPADGPTPDESDLADKLPARKGDLARLLDDLMVRLDDVGFFRSEGRRESLEMTIRVMVEGWHLSEPELHLMHGILKELHRGSLRRNRADGSVDALRKQSER